VAKGEMTRRNRCERLEVLWNKMPLTQHGMADGGDFLAWQGAAAALLSFNPHLQSEFRDAVRSISDMSSSFSPLPSRQFEQVRHRILTILSEAMNELKIPEESAPALADEHGIWWFINHCTWKSRVALFLWLGGAAIAVFGVGFKSGTTEIGRDLYRQYMALPTPHPTVPTTTPQSITSPSSENTPDMRRNR
jgi:hypothetical protein